MTKKWHSKNIDTECCELLSLCKKKVAIIIKMKDMPISDNYMIKRALKFYYDNAK